jgi:DNA-binding transcriptional regulator YhcF (GntR family)
LQLAGQLKWTIAGGEAQPGAALPTVERMAAAVGLNRNTVNAVYNELARQGLLELRRGTGTRVADGAPVAGWQGRAPLLQLIDTLLEEAVSLGFSAQEAAFLMLARGAWTEHQQRQRPRIGLLATSDCDATGFAAALADAAGYVVETAFLADLQGDPPAVAWPQWQVAVVRAGAVGPEVRGLPPDVRPVALDWVPAPGMLRAFAGLPPGAPVAMVAVSDQAARLVRRALVAAGLGQLRVFSGTTGDSPLMAALPHMVQVWADTVTTAVLRERQPGLTVHTFSWELAPGAREALQQACRRALQQALRHAYGRSPEPESQTS